MYGMGLIHWKVLWRRAETQARRRNYLSVSGGNVSYAVPMTDFVVHPLRPGRFLLWIWQYLRLLYRLVGYEQALSLD